MQLVFQEKIGLPCQHIVFLLKSFSLLLFNPVLFRKRWKRGYYETNESVSAPIGKEIITTVSSNIDTEKKTQSNSKI